jgi:hypothetical protein
MALVKKEHKLNGLYYKVPATTEEMVVYSIFGALIIGWSYYYFSLKSMVNLKLYQFNTLEGKKTKKKTLRFFCLKMKKEIIDLKRIRNRGVYKK